jgi:hypothetical protein
MLLAGILIIAAWLAINVGVAWWLLRRAKK